MPYRVLIGKSAQRELDGLPNQIRDRVLNRLAVLKTNPRSQGTTKLQGQDDAYRLRVGDYRLLFTVDDGKREVIIYAVGHRKEIYRRR